MSIVTGLARSNADAVLKEFYLPGIRSILNNEIFLLQQIESNTTDIEGRRAVVAINVGRNHGVGARGELEPLPTPGAQQYADQFIPLKNIYGRIQLAGPVMASMGSDRGSFTRSLQSETQGITRDTRNDVSRQVYGDGTGAIAVVASAAGNVITLNAATNRAQMAQFGKNMRIDVGTTANPQAAGTTYITAVNRAAKTITTAAALTVTGGQFVFRQGSGGVVGTTQREITGLKAQIANTGALWGIDPAVVEDWVSFVKPGAGAVSEDMFIEASQEVNLASGEQLDLWVTTAAVQRGVSKLLQSIKQFPNTTVLKGGYTALDISDISQGNTGANTVSLYYEKDMVEDGTAYGLSTNRLQCYTMSDWEFMQEDGAILSRVANTDAYEATLFRYMEIATDGRNAHAKITGITTA